MRAGERMGLSAGADVGRTLRTGWKPILRAGRGGPEVPEGGGGRGEEADEEVAGAGAVGEVVEGDGGEKAAGAEHQERDALVEFPQVAFGPGGQ